MASRINVNTASIEELSTISGISLELAEAICARREKQPFVRIEELIEIAGIGPNNLKSFVAQGLTLESLPGTGTNGEGDGTMEKSSVLTNALKAFDHLADKDPESYKLVREAAFAAERKVKDLQAIKDASVVQSLRETASTQPDTPLESALTFAGASASCSGAHCGFGCGGGCAIVCIASGGAGVAIAAAGGTFGGSGTSIALNELSAPTAQLPDC
ncbi:MAG: helix-hairpin-helix domain-containing protein [Planctomycetota bacterium]|jgi:competence ComEA-like helix-hairpin-helix protein